jgi:HEAT repeat protein
MRVGTRKSLVWLLLAIAPLYAATDKLQDALKGLASEDTSVSRDAEKFLLQHRQQAEPFLRAMFHDDSKPPLARFRAAKLLGDFGDTTAVPDMQHVLASGSEANATVRVEIIRSLVRLGSSSTLIYYLKQGKDDSPSVKAAIAIGLQDNTDEDSKKALSGLLANKDPRVFQAAFTAVCKIYQPATSKETNCPSSAGASTGVSSNQGPRFALGDKMSLTPGDQAIFQALQSRQASDDPQVSHPAAQLLNTLSEHYKQE